MFSAACGVSPRAGFQHDSYSLRVGRYIAEAVHRADEAGTIEVEVAYLHQFEHSKSRSCPSHLFRALEQWQKMNPALRLHDIGRATCLRASRLICWTNSLCAARTVVWHWSDLRPRANAFLGPLSTIVVTEGAGTLRCIWVAYLVFHLPLGLPCSSVAPTLCLRFPVGSHDPLEFVNLGDVFVNDKVRTTILGGTSSSFWRVSLRGLPAM